MDAYNKYCQALDIRFSENIMERLGQFGDDKVTGNRSAGSKACNDAAKYLYDKFLEAGLTNVSMDKFQVNGWTYKGAAMWYKDDQGQTQKIVLGGYASNFNDDYEEVTIVDGGRGTIDELEAVGDITNKLVLVSINNPTISNEYWMNLPAYEAYLHGAKGILIALTWEAEHDDNLISFDLQAPAYCSTLAISMKDVRTLKKMIHSNPKKEMKVVLHADSVVEPYADSYNIVGEIRGSSPEVIYLTAHYDGYYHSFFDDANGVSIILGISKAITESGYTPAKTIRVIAHGAEEWGQGSKDFDWACGSFYEIEKIHPEWKEKAFALINIDGNFPITDEKNFRIYSSYELYEYTKQFIQLYMSNSNYHFEVVCPSLMLPDDFNYYKNGIPTIMAGEDFDHSIYYENYYHSMMDSKDVGFDRKTYEMIHKLYGRFLFDLDNLPMKPLDFNTRFEIMKKELIPSIVGNVFIETVNEVCITSKQLSEAIQSINSHYNDAKKDRKHIPCETVNINYQCFNRMLFQLLKKIQDCLLAFTWEKDVNTLTFSHSVAMNNITLLKEAIAGLKTGSEPLKDIIDNDIRHIDNNKFVLEFSRKTYDFFAYRIPYGNGETMGDHMIKKPNEDLFDVAHSLKLKYDEYHPKVDDEIIAFENALKNQRNYLEEILKEEIEDMKAIIGFINNIIKSFYKDN